MPKIDENVPQHDSLGDSRQTSILIDICTDMCIDMRIDMCIDMRTTCI